MMIFRNAVLAVACWSPAIPVSCAESPTINTPRGELKIFPADNPWNQDISRLPVHPLSQDYLSSVGLEKPLHPDFGTVWNGAPSGIPYNLVAGNQAKRRAKLHLDSPKLADYFCARLSPKASEKTTSNRGEFASANRK